MIASLNHFCASPIMSYFTETTGNYTRYHGTSSLRWVCTGTVGKLDTMGYIKHEANEGEGLRCAFHVREHTTDEERKQRTDRLLKRLRDHSNVVSKVVKDSAPETTITIGHPTYRGSVKVFLLLERGTQRCASVAVVSF